MSDKYKRILEEIQEKSLLIEQENKKSFYKEIVKDVFVEKMGYGGGELWQNDNKCFFRKEGIIIQGSSEKESEKEISMFSDYLDEERCPWGIFLSMKGIWLINSEIKQDLDNPFQNRKIVLEIVYGRNTDQKYFKYFSEENTIGKRKNACFFRDIINYRNNGYKGKEKSWFAYHSALKRFFDFYAEYKGDFRENIYEKIGYSFFVEFIKKNSKCQSWTSVRNTFFYIKDFMQINSSKKNLITRKN